MARRLQQIADEINQRYPRLVARVEKSHCNTGRKLSRGVSTRGKGRSGNRLIVRWRYLSPLDPKSRVLDHDASEWCRRNEEVERWLQQEASSLVEPEPTKGMS